MRNIFMINPPILVVVADGRYECFSLSGEPSERDRALFETLQNAGGVSDTVEDGSYYFNVEVLGDNTYAMTLDRVEG